MHTDSEEEDELLNGGQLAKRRRIHSLCKQCEQHRRIREVKAVYQAEQWGKYREFKQEKCE